MTAQPFDGYPLTIQLKQGVYTNLMLSTTYLLQGEIVFTTDTLQVYIADGSNNKLQIPVLPASTAALSGTTTVVLAKLTTLGSNGSLTVVNGIVTAYVAPT